MQCPICGCDLTIFLWCSECGYQGTKGDNTMHIGFTGTRKGMTDNQKSEIIKFLRSLKHIEAVHHGDCLGADSEFHVIASGLKIIIHPPKDPKYRANCVGDVILAPKDYIKRNHFIVDSCHLLIAAPSTDKELRRSGTWATIRYASSRKPVYIFYPNGDTEVQ